MGVGERFLQVWEGVAVIADVALCGRRAHKAELGAYVRGTKSPLFHPAVSRADGEWESAIFPCGGGFNARGDVDQQFEQLPGSQGTVGEYAVPVDGESVAATYIGIAIGAKKRKPRLISSLLSGANPLR